MIQEVQEIIIKWKKDNFSRSLLHFKETKQAEAEFVKAQKPWAKLHHRADRAKKKYHRQCRQVELMTAKLKEMEKQAAAAPEDVQKLRDALNA